jgi:hypothetical protein
LGNLIIRQQHAVTGYCDRQIHLKKSVVRGTVGGDNDYNFWRGAKPIHLSFIVEETTMAIHSKSLPALLVGFSVVAAFASQAFAQPDVQVTKPLTGHGPKLSEKRKAALQDCMSGTQFDSDAYVACMTKHHQSP